MAKPRSKLKPASSRGGKPTMYPGPKVRPGIMITETAWEKAKNDAAKMGDGVSSSNAIEAAIRAYTPPAAH